MNIKRKAKILCSCIVTICLSVLSLKYLTDLMELKNSDIKYTPFFEQKDDFDVLFMGSSHVINGIYPMELWNDYGIVSYTWVDIPPSWQQLTGFWKMLWIIQIY